VVRLSAGRLDFPGGQESFGGQILQFAVRKVGVLFQAPLFHLFEQLHLALRFLHALHLFAAGRFAALPLFGVFGFQALRPQAVTAEV